MFGSKLTSKIVAETTWSFATKGLAFVCVYSTHIFLARTLGVNAYGDWSVFFSFLTVVLLLSYLGLNPATQYFVAKYTGTEWLRSVWVSSLRLRVKTGLGFMAVYTVVFVALPSSFVAPSFRFAALVAIPWLLSSNLLSYFKRVTAGLHDLRTGFAITSVEHVARLGLVVAAVLFVAPTVSSIVVAMGLATAFTVVLAWLIMRRRFRHLPPQSNKNFSGEIFGYGWQVFAISLFVMVATEVDTLMLGALSSASEVGVYAGAKQLITHLPQISTAIGMAAMTPFAKLAHDNRVELSRLFRRLLLVNAAIFALISFGVFVWSDELVPIILGADYAPSSLVIKILLPFVIVMSFTPFLDIFLDYQGYVSRRLIVYLATSVFNVVLNILLIPRYGAVGAACATSLSFVPSLVANAVYVRRVWGQVLATPSE